MPLTTMEFALTIPAKLLPYEKPKDKLPASIEYETQNSRREVNF